MARARMSGSRKQVDHVAFHRGTTGHAAGQHHPPAHHAPAPHAPAKHPAVHHPAANGAKAAVHHQKVEAARQAHQHAVVAHKTEVRAGMVDFVHSMALAFAASRENGSASPGSAAPDAPPPPPNMSDAMRDVLGGAIGGKAGAMISNLGHMSVGPSRRDE